MSLVVDFLCIWFSHANSEKYRCCTLKTVLSVMSFLTHLNAETPFTYGINTEKKGTLDSLKDVFL